MVWLNLISVPVTLGAGAYFYWLDLTIPSLRLDREMLNQFYTFVFIVSGFCGVLGVLGIYFVDDESESSYVTTSFYGFYVGYFILSTYLGVFLSPVFLILLISFVINVAVFGAKKLLPALLVILFMVVVNAVTTITGITKAWPLVESLSYTEQHYMHITVYTYLFMIPFSVFLLVYLARTYINSYRRINFQLENLTSKLSRYLSPQIIESIFGNESGGASATSRKNLTVCFVSLQDFDNLFRDENQDQMFKVLNRYLNEITKSALYFGGTIDKFIGDEVMIFFGDPFTKGSTQDAESCVTMAMDMMRRIEELNLQLQNELSQSLKIRIGINTGFSTVGSFGSKDKMGYTAIGGQINLAARIRSVAQGGQILVSHNTYSLVRDKFASRKIEVNELKGVKRDFQIFEILNTQEKDNKHGNPEFSVHFVQLLSSLGFYDLSQEEQKSILNKIIQ